MTRFEFYAKAAILLIICAITIYSGHEKKEMMSTLNFTIGILWGMCLWRDCELLPDCCRRFFAKILSKAEANPERSLAAAEDKSP